MRKIGETARNAGGRLPWVIGTGASAALSLILAMGLAPANPDIAAPATTQLASPPATSRPATQPAVSLPARWHGKYGGTLELISPDKPAGAPVPRPPQKIPTELTIEPIPGTPDVTWKLVYSVEKREERNYILRAVPGFPGRYLMDEQQGIFIDHALIGDTLTCQFTVAGSLLTSSFELRDDGIYFEIISSNLARPRRSTVGDMTIDSFPVRTIQRGILKKVG